MNKDSLNYYYQHCAFPKPGSRKRQKKMNGWKGKKYRYCRYCGKPYADRHEIFGGPNRQISIDYGFQVDLCRRHHKELHANTSEWAKSTNNQLRQESQRNYEYRLKEAGFTDKGAREEWMKLIGKNYL